MAQQITDKVSVNGWMNLWTQAQADGYTGTPIIAGGTILNFNATVAYVHALATGAGTSPSGATGADGLPIGTTASTAPAAGVELLPGTDIAGVWVFTSGAQDIKYSIVGK